MTPIQPTITPGINIQPMMTPTGMALQPVAMQPMTPTMNMNAPPQQNVVYVMAQPQPNKGAPLANSTQNMQGLSSASPPKESSDNAFTAVWVGPKTKQFYSVCFVCLVITIIINTYIHAKVSDNNVTGMLVLIFGPVCFMAVAAVLFYILKCTRCFTKAVTNVVAPTPKDDGDRSGGGVPDHIRDSAKMDKALATWVETSTDAAEAALFSAMGMWVSPGFFMGLSVVGVYYVLIALGLLGLTNSRAKKGKD